MHDRRHPYRLEPEDYRHPGDIVFVTFSARTGLDNPPTAATILSKLHRLDQLCGTRVNAYVIMPDHVHVVLELLMDDGDIFKWMRYFKREVSRAMRQPGMCQRSFWDRHMRKEQDEQTAVYYVLNNPVRRKLCDDVYDWPYSLSRYHPKTRGGPPM